DVLEDLERARDAPGSTCQRTPQEWDTTELLWFLADLFIAHEAGATNFFGSGRFDPCPLVHRLRQNRNEIAHDRQYRILLQSKPLSDQFLRTFIDNAVAVAELSSDFLREADRRYRDLKSGRAPRSNAQSAIDAANHERLLCEAEALASAARTKMLVQKRLEIEALMALNKQRELQKSDKDKASSTCTHKRKRRDDDIENEEPRSEKRPAAGGFSARTTAATVEASGPPDSILEGMHLPSGAAVRPSQRLWGTDIFQHSLYGRRVRGNETVEASGPPDSILELMPSGAAVRPSQRLWGTDIFQHSLCGRRVRGNETVEASGPPDSILEGMHLPSGGRCAPVKRLCGTGIPLLLAFLV
ncbi:hypothetical protein HKX48_002980, partial [Thoreauomyces humboldtii]